MAWIESHTVLLRHRKVIEAAKELDIKPVMMLGHIHALWHAVLEQQEDGDLSNWSDETIAEMAAFAGSPTGFVKALQQQNFLENKIVHDWLDYAGKYLTAKYRTSNPKKLKQILAIHKSISSRSKVGKKSTQDAIGLSNHNVLKKEGGPGETKTAALPDWLSAEAWRDFREHRQKIRKPLSPRAEELAIKRLDELRRAGHNPTAVLEQSILGGWQGLFEIKGGSFLQKSNAMHSAEPKGFQTIREIQAELIGNGK